MPYLMLPIVLTKKDTGKFRIFPFLVLRHGDSVIDRPVDLEIVDSGELDSARAEDEAAASLEETSLEGASHEEAVLQGASREEAVRSGETFDRVTSAYDLRRMARARVVAVGIGGAATFVEDLARCGVGEFVLIDGDTVSESNIATQQVYRKDIGRPKAPAVAPRRPHTPPAGGGPPGRGNLHYPPHAAMRALCLEPIGGRRPAVSLLCGLTDNFFAQARINAIALNLGVPSLCAQVWREGRGAEITFTYPGVTPACHRCILSSRYTAFLARGFVNDVTSHGTPIFATSRLNSIKGFLALALLHHQSDGKPSEVNTRFADLTARIGDRNLLQIRMDPDLAETVGVGTFDRVFGLPSSRSLLFDETVWRPQTPESGAGGEARCPDCGGTGDLRDAIGTFDDTRQIRIAGR